MGRPKTKGRRITISLSLSATAEAEQRAERAGLTLKDWMEKQLDRALTPQPRVVHGEATTTTNRHQVDPRFKP